MAHKIVLASQSPRRKLLLEWAGIPFDVMVKATSETYPADMPIDHIPIHIARNKALALMQDEAYQHFERNRPVLAADTIVVLGSTVIGKPANRKDAIAILQQLSGKTHRVITGVVILHDRSETSFSESTDVTFYPLSDEQIIFYVDHFQPFDKAGAYAIQEWIGVTGIERIHGDFYNVMGLPISRVVRSLKQAGLY